SVTPVIGARITGASILTGPIEMGFSIVMGRRQIVDEPLADKASGRTGARRDHYSTDCRRRQRSAPRRRPAQAVSPSGRKARAALGGRVPDPSPGRAKL